MNIFILVSKLYPWVGGTETQTENIAKEFHKMGHKITVLTRQFQKKRIPKIEDRGFIIKRFDTHYTIPVIRYILHFLKFFNEIRKNRKKIDILFCMQLTPNGFIGIVAKKFFKIPVISYVRGGDWYFAKNDFFGRFIISRVLKESNIVLAQTEKIKEAILKEFPQTTVKVISNGIYPYTKKTSDSAPEKSVVFVGILTERKGVKYLIPAMKNTKEKLIIAGYGHLEKELRKQARGQNIKFVGCIPSESVRDFMNKNGKILVLPSIRGEGLPNVILEAMSVGIPSIATNIAGIPDVIKNGETGILVEPRDIEGLRKAITRLSRNEKLREEMSRNCLKDIKKYYWKNIINQLEDTITSCVPQ